MLSKVSLRKHLIFTTILKLEIITKKVDVAILQIL